MDIRQELLDRGDEVVTFRQLIERFDEVEEEFKGIPWNLMQIYSNFNILVGEKPCTDVVNRQVVKEQMIKYGFHAPDMTVTEFIEDLPPANLQKPKMEKVIKMRDATPEERELVDKYVKSISKPTGVDFEALLKQEPKTGYWIDTGSGQMCSRCGEIQYGYDSFRRFCAYCGARMVEPQESEDKSCDNCKWNKTDKCQPSICATIGCDGHGLWKMIESEEE